MSTTRYAYADNLGYKLHIRRRHEPEKAMCGQEHLMPEDDGLWVENAFDPDVCASCRKAVMPSGVAGRTT